MNKIKAKKKEKKITLNGTAKEKTKNSMKKIF